jgi:cytochrome c oxidase subunit 2
MNSRKAAIGMLATALTFVLTGCAGWTVHQAGPQAARIAELWWLVFYVSCAVYGVVAVLVMWALVRSPRASAEPEPELPERTSRRYTIAVGTGVALTIITLFVLVGNDVVTARALEKFGTQNPLIIEVTGRQWWWEVRYVDPVAGNRFTTANEIHIPVGRPVMLSMTSGDVIHSLWVPELHGKRDLIPAYGTHLRLQADRAGSYYGECAEFCGYQHAKMRLLVIAQPEGEFAAWLHEQRQPAQTPQTEQEKRGQQVFLSGTCIMCHTIQGTPAGGKVAPDLTHLASRQTIAAGSAPNTRGHLGGWILDPQSIKPGTKMPPNPMSAQDLQALLAYLGSLK